MIRILKEEVKTPEVFFLLNLGEEFYDFCVYVRNNVDDQNQEFLDRYTKDAWDDENMENAIEIIYDIEKKNDFDWFFDWMGKERMTFTAEDIRKNSEIYKG
jgi:hypothetical protein